MKHLHEFKTTQNIIPEGIELALKYLIYIDIVSGRTPRKRFYNATIGKIGRMVYGYQELYTDYSVKGWTRKARDMMNALPTELINVEIVS